MQINKYTLIGALVACLIIGLSLGTLIPGRQGEIGLTGPQGIQGLQGPAGVTGVQGLTGIDGQTGPAGTPGLLGIQGLQGPIGATGIKGDKGDTGERGEEGIPGYNVLSPSSIYVSTITVTRGTSFTIYGSGFSTDGEVKVVDSAGNWASLGTFMVSSFGLFSMSPMVSTNTTVGLGSIVVYIYGQPVTSTPIKIK